MKFFPTPSPSYFAPASIQLLDDQGALKEFPFDVEFKRFKRTELEALDADMAVQRTMPGVDMNMALLARVCKGWRVKPPKAEGADIEPTPILVAFTEQAARDVEEDYPGFLVASAAAFYAAQSPARAAHYSEKNS